MGPIEIEYPPISQGCTPEERDWVNSRAGQMSEREKILFNGAMLLTHPQTAAEVIDLALQLGKFEALYPAGNRRALGLFVAKYLQDEYGEFAHLPKRDVGAIYQKGHSGVFVTDSCGGQGAYVTQEYPIQPLYDGTNLAELTRDDYAVRIRLSSPDCPDGVWVRMPDNMEINGGYPDELAIALDSIDAVSLEECTVQEISCNLPGLESLLSQYEDTEKLFRDCTNMGYILEERWQGQAHAMDHFLAALELEGCDRLDWAIDISQNLHCYDFLPPGASAVTEYGRQHAEQNRLATPEGFGFEDYGRQELARDGMQATEHGYIRRNDQSFFYEHGQPPQVPEMEM